MIYHLNADGIYYWISAIETAQLNRQRMIDSIGYGNKHIFCGIYSKESVYKRLTDYGFDVDRVIWIYDFYSDFKLAPPSYSVEKFESKLQNGFVKTTNKDVISYSWEDSPVKIKVKLENGYVFASGLYTGNILISVDYYTYEKNYTEFFRDNKLYLRRFYNINGSVAVDEMFDESLDDDKAMFLIANHMPMSRGSFIENMLLQILHKDDIVLVDRYLVRDFFSRALYEAAKIFYIAHSTHCDFHDSDDNFVKLFGYGEKFRLKDRCAGYIMATPKQAEDAVKHIEIMFGDKDYKKVRAIPVGCIDKLQYSENRKSNSFVSVGRLVSSKGFDTVIKAIAKAKQFVSDIRLDIYGVGLLKSYLEALIEQFDCKDNIFLCGYHDLSSKYLEYDAMITGTVYEGFGLSCSECLGQGCPVICFDAPYMGESLVEDGYNGYVVHLDKDIDDNERADRLSEALIKYCRLDDNEKQIMRKNVYKSAERYLFKEVANLWNQFLTDTTV